MMNDPVRHLMWHHLGQKGVGLIAVERHVKAQPPTPIMGLTGTAPAQVTPDSGGRQVRIVAPRLAQALLYMCQKPCLAGIPMGKVINVVGKKIGHG